MSKTLAVFEMDDVTSALNAARMARELLDINPDAEAMIAVSGFDDDPRELDNIPEACAIMKAFGDAVGWKYLARFEPIIVGIVLIAMGNDEAHRNGEHIIIHPEAMFKLCTELERWKLDEYRYG